MSSPVTGITHVQANQNSKEVTVNEAIDRLDLMMNGMATVTIADSGDTTITGGALNAAENFVLKLTGTLTAGRNLVVPAKNKPFVIINGTAQTVTVKTASGTGVAVASAATKIVFCDGTNVVAVT